MILLQQNTQEYNNDLRAMIMAFYTGVKIVDAASVSVSVSVSASVPGSVSVPDGQDIEFVFCAEYRENETTLSVQGEDEVVLRGDYRDKPSFRNKLKQGAYELLCRRTGRRLPWGNLTGVRPTKIAMKQLLDGCDFESVVRHYRELYGASEQKARLATRVAAKELSLVRGMDLENSYCLYVGIPFCPSRCLYCSFTSYPIELYRDRASVYIDKLCEELDFISETYRHKQLAAIYVGGGTPTSLDAGLLGKLMHKLADIAGALATPVEFTVEAGRPDSITAEKLRVMKQCGVTRISINPQTMNDETLRIIGRAHTAEQARETFALARQEGFDNINMDLIAGLPGENLDSMRFTLERIRELMPESITVHSLAIKRAANLRQQLDIYGTEINHDMDEMHNLAADAAAELQMEPYYLYRQKNIGGNLENVGYARAGRECLYNVLIMEELTDIIAAGAGAATKLTYPAENRVERVENCKSVEDYIQRFDEMIERKCRRIY